MIAKLVIPADLVPDSATSRRIRDAGVVLSERYVVYCGSRHGVGHDKSYG